MLVFCRQVTFSSQVREGQPEMPRGPVRLRSIWRVFDPHRSFAGQRAGDTKREGKGVAASDAARKRCLAHATLSRRLRWSLRFQ